jgi:hypothetical protein
MSRFTGWVWSMIESFLEKTSFLYNKRLSLVKLVDVCIKKLEKKYKCREMLNLKYVLFIWWRMYLLILVISNYLVSYIKIYKWKYWCSLLNIVFDMLLVKWLVNISDNKY